MTRPTAVILGPTAVGKTGSALLLAERIGAEIVSADAFQVYRGMDIATAKPSAEERRRVRHHLLDILDLNEGYSAARFRRDALAAIAEIEARSRAVLVVGGSGLYLRVLAEGIFDAPAAATDPALRRRLAEKEAEEGPGALHRLLRESDPAAAGRIHPRDLKRLIRALEVFILTGRPISGWQRQWADRGGRRPPNGRVYLKLGLRRRREDLAFRIASRVRRMLEAGLVEETRRLLAAGAGRNRVAWKALGYREIESHLRGECGRAEAAERLAANTRRYARRQMTWFRRDREIRWVDLEPEEGDEPAAEKLFVAMQETALNDATDRAD